MCSATNDKINKINIFVVQDSIFSFNNLITYISDLYRKLFRRWQLNILQIRVANIDLSTNDLAGDTSIDIFAVYIEVLGIYILKLLAN